MSAREAEQPAGPAAPRTTGCGEIWVRLRLKQVLCCFLSLAIGHAIGWTTTHLVRPAARHAASDARGPGDPSYQPAPHAVCNPPPHVRERAGVPPPNPHCASVKRVTASSVSVFVSVPSGASVRSHNSSVEVSIAAFGRMHSPARGVASTPISPSTRRVLYTVDGLTPDSDYVLSAYLLADTAGGRRAVCRVHVATGGQGRNLVRNPGFEDCGDSPFSATRFHSGDAATARRWTPFYDGGMRIVCGPLVCSAAGAGQGGGALLLQPRSGRCVSQFGPGCGDERETRGEGQPKFHGAHQAVALGVRTRSFQVEAWYYVAPGTDLQVAAEKGKSPADSLALGVGWQYADGAVADPVFIDLGAELALHQLHPTSATSQKADRTGWHPVCAVVRSPTRDLQMAHIFFHFHDRTTGALFVDDVSVVSQTAAGAYFRRTSFSPPEREAKSEADAESDSPTSRSGPCHTISSEPAERDEVGYPLSPWVPKIHLRAEVRPQPKQLTLAVPLTGDRVLRLESLSRLYGGGPVSAAVLVRDEDEAKMFAHVWRRRPWLSKHVDVSLVYMSRERVKEELIPINALRNVAVKMASSEFTLMLDVDMTPATESFACFRDPTGSFLSGLLPVDSGRIFTTPVFITDVHVRPASNKGQLLNQLRHRVATSYCLNSQRPVKIEKWYSAREPYEARFTTDFEPYGICRRDAHPAYDERFVGYGFNKISWAWGAEMAGQRLFVLSDSFLTHLNHVDNEWVANINVSLYLRTWRRFFAFVAESAALDAPLLQNSAFVEPRAQSAPHRSP